MTPRLAIIIPHYNDAVRLGRCLEALEPQVSDEIEVVVADNASPCDLTEVTQRFAWAQLVVQPEKGAGPARNAGIEATSAPWLAFIDADCIADADWVAQALELAQGEQLVVTGGRVDVFDETPAPRSGAEAFEAVFAFKMRRYLEEEAFLGAGNLVVSRRGFEQAGPFRPAVSEDKEWSQRAASQGLTLAYDDALGVSHPSRSDWPALARKWERVTSESYDLRLQRGEGRLGWFIRALAMLPSIVVHAPKVMGSPILTWQEKGRGIATLARLRVARMAWMIRQILTSQT